jgi:hypothetical protein
VHSRVDVQHLTVRCLLVGAEQLRHDLCHENQGLAYLALVLGPSGADFSAFGALREPHNTRE